MKKILVVLTTMMLTVVTNYGQDISQTIRGTVVDQESKFPLIGVTVQLTSSDEFVGTTTDIDGKFRLENVPVGRQSLKMTYVGYEDVELSDLIVTSAKELILEVEMFEGGVVLNEFKVKATQSGDVRNEMAMISSRSFNVEETNRYAGSRGDPGRMASNFAGVQGADDSRNDIIVRGNSPSGVLWRLEGVSIPNPNHFAIPGTTGGSVTILNNKYLSNSDFYTGAFPAEFSNTTAGVFDLRMRNGNNEKHEFNGQLGFLGTELSAEGPLSKNKKSSYLVNYRYSSLQLFSALNINVGTNAIPKYQDAAFRLNFPQKNGGNLAVWGIGGYSNIDIVLSTEEAPNEETLIYGSNDRDQYFGSNMAIGGISYNQPLNKNTFFKATIAASHQEVDANHDLIVRRVENDLYVIDSLPQILDYNFTERKIAAYASLNKKLKNKGTLKIGLNTDFYFYNYLDSARVIRPSNELEPIGDWEVRWNAQETAVMIQPYIQYKKKLNQDLVFTAGLSSTIFTMNENSISPLEPRLGLAYTLKEGKLTFGYGLHSQNLPGYLYFYGNETADGQLNEYNRDLGLSKSHQLALGYDINFGKAMRFKTELYYQRLFDQAVEIQTSSFSLVNSGSGFSRFFPEPLQNTGIGRNYGLEVTLERFFKAGYYILFTGSVFDSKYQGSDKVWRNTSFNGRFATNAVFAKEIKFESGSTFNFGGKLTYAGGRWYGPADEEASAEALEVIYQDENRNSIQFAPYFRLDGKITYTINKPKVTHEIGIDFVNLTNTKNILTLTYAPDHPSGNPIQEEYQLGFLPIFYYKIDF